MLRRFSRPAALLVVLYGMSAQAEHAHHHHHHGHHRHALQSPVGIMGDHVHAAGEWMASYKYSHMSMSGNRSGTGGVSDAQVLADFMVAPQQMDMEMHMVSLMYGLTDELTVMGMVPYTSLEMDHVTRMGQRFTTNSDGIGDVSLSGAYQFAQWQDQRDISHSFLANAGLYFPTGSIDERDDTPAMANAKLPYPMQLGSGTYDPLIGITYTGEYDIWGWGAQANHTFRIGRNDEGYSLGDVTKTNLWASVGVAPGWSLSTRLEGRHWGDIDGRDSDLNPMMVPTARTDLRGGTRMDALIGASYSPQGLSGNRFALEIGTPVYQDLDGPQLETDLRLTVGWQITF